MRRSVVMSLGSARIRSYLPVAMLHASAPDRLLASLAALVPSPVVAAAEPTLCS